MKLFPTYSNLYNQDTLTSQTVRQMDRQRDGRIAVAIPRSAVASRGKNT